MSAGRSLSGDRFLRDQKWRRYKREKRQKKSESKPGREKADDQISKHGNVTAGFGDERKREESLKGASRPQPGLDPRLLGQGFGGTAASLGPQGIPVCCGVSGSQQRPDLPLGSLWFPTAPAAVSASRPPNSDPLPHQKRKLSPLNLFIHLLAVRANGFPTLPAQSLISGLSTCSWAAGGQS